jgi:hypothetical protein
MHQLWRGFIGSESASVQGYCRCQANCGVTRIEVDIAGLHSIQALAAISA